MEKVGLNRRNLELEVYDVIKSMILDRRLMPGDKIPLDNLTDELGVSRTPMLVGTSMAYAQFFFNSIVMIHSFLKALDIDFSNPAMRRGAYSVSISFFSPITLSNSPSSSQMPQQFSQRSR